MCKLEETAVMKKIEGYVSYFDGYYGLLMIYSSPTSAIDWFNIARCQSSNACNLISTIQVSSISCFQIFQIFPI